MQISNCVQQLIHYILSMNYLQFTILQSHTQITLYKLKHSINMSSLSNNKTTLVSYWTLSFKNALATSCIGLFSLTTLTQWHNSFQSNNTRMIQLHKIVELAICSFGISNILIGINYLFDGNSFTWFLIYGLINHPIGSTSQHLYNLMRFVYLIIDLFIRMHSRTLTYLYSI